MQRVVEFRQCSRTGKNLTSLFVCVFAWLTGAAALISLTGCGAGVISGDGDSDCTTTRCMALGKNCGEIEVDGCGVVQCGDCAASESCGGSGTPNLCGTTECQPSWECEQPLNGNETDGCGSRRPNPACDPSTEDCTITRCAKLGRDCGEVVVDGCGLLRCGVCAAPETCGAGGTPNVCGVEQCTPGSDCEQPLGRVLSVAKDGTGTHTTIQAAANVAEAGDTVQVMPGTYNEYVVVKNSGSAGKYITFKAKGDVVVTSPYGGQPTYYGVFTVWNKNFIIIDGFTTKLGHTGFTVWKADNVIIRNNHVENPYHDGINVLSVVGGWNTNCLIEGNTVSRTTSGGISYGEMISIETPNVCIVRNNHVKGNTLGEAIVIKGAPQFVKVYNNLVEHSYVGIYAGGGGQGGYGAHDIEVYNNIAFNNDGGGKSGILVANEMRSGEQIPPTDIQVHDNWASGGSLGFGFGLYSSTGVSPVYGTIEFMNNRACNNTWTNYLFSGSFTVRNLINSNNIVSTPCVPPVWNPDPS